MFSKIKISSNYEIEASKKTEVIIWKERLSTVKQQRFPKWYQTALLF